MTIGAHDRNGYSERFATSDSGSATGWRSWNGRHRSSHSAVVSGNGSPDSSRSLATNSAIVTKLIRAEIAGLDESGQAIDQGGLRRGDDDVAAAR